MRTTLTKIIYFILIFGAIFTDTIFVRYFGYFGRTALNLFIPFLFIMYIGIYKRLRMNKFLKSMVYLLIFLIMVNIIADGVWCILDNSVVLYTENIFLKSIKSIIYWLEITAYMILIYNCVVSLEKKEILRPFVFTFFFLFIILIIELLTMPYAFAGLHYIDSPSSYFGASYYPRVRLTTTESSTTIPLIVAYGAITLYYYKCVVSNKYLIFLSAICLIVFGVSSGSKTKYFCFMLIAMVFFIEKSKKRDKSYGIKQIVALVMVILVFLWGWNVLYSKFDASRGSTYSVRALPSIASFINSFIYPVGTGGAVSGYVLNQMVKKIYDFFSTTNFGKTISYYEIVNMLNSNEDNKSVIAGVFNYAGQWGIIGTFFWAKSIWNYLKCSILKDYKGKKILLSGLICLIFFITFMGSFANHYMVWGYFIILGYLLKEGEQINDAENQKKISIIEDESATRMHFSH